MLRRAVVNAATYRRPMPAMMRTLSGWASWPSSPANVPSTKRMIPQQSHRKNLPTVRSFSAQPPGGGNVGGLPPWMHQAMGGPQAQPGDFLQQYTTNLTQMAADGKLDPIIGRHEEIRRCLQILARRTKNSA